MLEPWQQLAMGSRGLVCTGAAGGGTALSLEGGLRHNGCSGPRLGGAALSTRGPKQDALRHKVPADQGGLLWGSAPPVSVPALGSSFRSAAWGPQLAKRGVHPSEIFVSIAVLVLQPISQLRLEMTALSLRCIFLQ